MQMELTRLDLMRDKLITRGCSLSNAFCSHTVLNQKDHVCSVFVLCSYGRQDLDDGNEIVGGLLWQGHFGTLDRLDCYD